MNSIPSRIVKKLFIIDNCIIFEFDAKSNVPCSVIEHIHGILISYEGAIFKENDTWKRHDHVGNCIMISKESALFLSKCTMSMVHLIDPEYRYMYSSSCLVHKVDGTIPYNSKMTLEYRRHKIQNKLNIHYIGFNHIFDIKYILPCVNTKFIIFTDNDIICLDENMEIEPDLLTRGIKYGSGENLETIEPNYKLPLSINFSIKALIPIGTWVKNIFILYTKDKTRAFDIWTKEKHHKFNLSLKQMIFTMMLIIKRLNLFEIVQKPVWYNKIFPCLESSIIKIEIIDP